MSPRCGPGRESLESTLPVLQVFALFPDGVIEEAPRSRIVSVLLRQRPHLQDVLVVLCFHGIGQPPVALGTPRVEANDLFKQIGRLIDIAVEYQCVGQIHHVAGLARRLLVHPGKKGLGGLVFAQLVEHGAGEVQYCWVRGLNAAHLF